MLWWCFRKVRSAFIIIYILKKKQQPLHLSCAKFPSCHKSQFNQNTFSKYIRPVVPIYREYLVHEIKLIPSLGFVLPYDIFIARKAAVSCLLRRLFFFLPPIVFEEVFWSDGGSLTQSLFSFCFRGEGAASPLNSRRRRLGERSDWLGQKPIDSHVVPLAPVQLST